MADRKANSLLALAGSVLDEDFSIQWKDTSVAFDVTWCLLNYDPFQIGQRLRAKGGPFQRCLCFETMARAFLRITSAGVSPSIASVISCRIDSWV